MNKLKVIEVNVDDIGFGGVFSLVRSIIKNCPKSISIDIAAIELFENKENIIQLQECGCKVYYVGYTRNKLLKQLMCLINLYRLLQREKYDCVHIHSDVANKLFVSGLAAKMSGTNKIILHSHASGVEGQNRFIKNIFHIICRRFLKYIGTDFLSCSDLASKWMFPNIRTSNIRILKNGIDSDKFKFSQTIRDKMREEIGIKNEFVVGHVGRFSNVKNHDYLVDVFAQFHKKMKNSVLLLIGEGLLQNKIRDKVKVLGLSGKVIFYGTTNNVASLLQAMDVFVLPSLCEGFPIVGIEAQASGLPVLFSDQITKEAKLLESTIYLPIDKKSLLVWVEALMNLKTIPRVEANAILKQQKFDIRDSIKDLVSVYTA